MLFMLILSGCNFISGMVLEDKLTNHLNEKYDKEFKITKLVKEFDGNHGWHYRAVFHEKDSQENSVLYCYKDDLDEGTIINIKGEEYAVVDDYADIILQEQYAALIQEELGDDVMVKCKFETPDYMISDGELAAGLDVCMNDTSKYPCVYVYIFTDVKKINVDICYEVEEIMSNYNPHRQCVYVSFHEPFNRKNLETEYYENYNAVGSYLEKTDTAKKVEFSSFSRAEGYKGREVVKE